jgi:hypothetical protein
MGLEQPPQNFVAARENAVTASEARQSITAHLDDGWPRCARYDGRLFDMESVIESSLHRHF